MTDLSGTGTTASGAADARDAPLGGQHAVVTGGSRGIGAAIAGRLAALGASLTVIGRDRQALQHVVSDLSRTFGTPVGPEPADVTQPDQVRAAMEAAAGSRGPISILVNNAGTGKSAPFRRTDRALWDEMLELNLTSAYMCTREVLPGMIEAGFGRIINIASTAGLKGYPYVTAYCAAKHGMIGLTRALALETARENVTVNAVCPGYTETELTTRTIDNIVSKTGRSADDAMAELAALNPQKRLVQPREVAEAVAWLALPGSAAITGQAVAVAGGEVM